MSVIETRKYLHSEIIKSPLKFSEKLEIILNTDNEMMEIINIDWVENFYEDLQKKEWWWVLVKQVDPHDRLDWLWKAIALSSLTAGQGIFLDFSMSFFAGNGTTTGVILILAQFGFGKLMLDNLNIKGKRVAQKLLKWLKIPNKWHWEVRCLFSTLFLILSNRTRTRYKI